MYEIRIRMRVFFALAAHFIGQILPQRGCVYQLPAMAAQSFPASAADVDTRGLVQLNFGTLILG